MSKNREDIAPLFAKLEAQLQLEIDAAFAFSDQSVNPLPSAAWEKLYA